MSAPARQTRRGKPFGYPQTVYPKPSYSGLFITFEGGEGAGKSSLIERAYQQLSKEGALLCKTREPGGVALSEQIRSWLLHHPDVPIGSQAELLLFLAARAQNLEETIIPALKSGQIVLCDRYNDSSVAYQGYARGLGMSEVRSLSHHACQGWEPDLTFFLDLPPKLGIQRSHRHDDNKDRISTEEIEFHEKVRSGYQKIAEAEPERIVTLDSTLPLNELSEQILEAINTAHKSKTS